MPAVFLSADAAHGKDDLTPILVHGIKGNKRIGVIKVSVFIVPQTAEHGSGFHVVSIQDIGIWTGFEADGGVKEDSSVHVLLSLGVMGQIECIVPLHHRLIYQLAHGKTMDILRRLQIHPVGAFLRLIVIHREEGSYRFQSILSNIVKFR